MAALRSPRPEDGAPLSRRPRAAHVAVLLDGGIAAHLLPKSGRVVLGRSTDCDVVIEHPSVSRRHAVLHVGPTMRLEDLGSSNGTRVGGVALAPRKPAKIAPGALVELGAALVLVQAGDRATPASSPNAVDEGAIWAPDSPLARLAPLFDLVASSDLHLLLLGEPGVGKDVAAERVHRRSQRAAWPLVRVDCTMPEGAVDRELFGDARGDGHAPQPGALERAHGGSVLLDAVTSLPMTTQTRLVEALDERRFTRLGGGAALPLDVRLLSTSQKDLDAAVATGRFKQALRDRLEGIAIALPRLRDRPMDVPVLANAFVRAASRQLGKPAPTIARDALAALSRHPFPGNVREL
ncbi:MAG TPA: sigma 54-interacting transcriptional regulator, partial [Minicystis sp.]|nr:sigma 54-interacting transcriptional regulator [Minicystis sp.]